MDENIDFLLSYNVILVCNLHVNAGILHHYFSILWVTSQYYFALQRRPDDHPTCHSRRTNPSLRIREKQYNLG